MLSPPVLSVGSQGKKLKRNSTIQTAGKINGQERLFVLFERHSNSDHKKCNSGFESFAMPRRTQYITLTMSRERKEKGS
jgi:hypothetical protein